MKELNKGLVHIAILPVELDGSIVFYEKMGWSVY